MKAKDSWIKKMIRILSRCIPDRIYLRLIFYRNRRYRLSLRHPQTFNEKLQWLKIHNRNPQFTNLVDKYEVKSFVKDTIGAEYVIPTLGVWDRAEDIDIESLPQQFVLKCTHDSGSVWICKEKDTFNFGDVKKEIQKCLERNYFYPGREWPYKNVKPRVIAEKFISDESGGDLNDYKVFIFHGKPYCIQVDFDRHSNHRRNFYTIDWKYMPFTTCYPTEPSREIPKPICLGGLLSLAERLAKGAGTPAFVRIDFYIVQSQIYFGELTFYHGGGLEEFMPPEWDKRLGEKISLPTD